MMHFGHITSTQEAVLWLKETHSPDFSFLGISISKIPLHETQNSCYKYLTAHVTQNHHCDKTVDIENWTHKPILRNGAR